MSGTDLELDYQHGIHLLGGGAERFTARLIGSYLTENSVTNQAVGKINYAGQVGDGFNLPRFQVFSDVSYTNGPYQLLVQERFIGRGILDVTYVRAWTSIAIPCPPSRTRT